MAIKACHVFASTTQVGLIQALGVESGAVYGSLSLLDQYGKCVSMLGFG